MEEWPASEQGVLVSDQSFNSENASDIIASNIEFINALLAEHLHLEEIARDAVRSYYVDYYLAQVDNGGFSQFVYNSRWLSRIVCMVKEGLLAMNAVEHLRLFNESAAKVDRMEPGTLRAFLRGEYWGVNEQRDALDETHNQLFVDLAKIEDLIAINAAWLRSLPNLQVRTAAELRAEVERRAAALSDREQRKRVALENEPRHAKLIRALSLKAGHELSRITAGDPAYKHNGRNVIAWHFITDRGHHYMVEADGKATMFEGTTKKPVVEMDAL